MTIKLSDFILEQTVSESEIIDIEIEQAVAEIEVASALMEAYYKYSEMTDTMFMEGYKEEQRAKDFLNNKIKDEYLTRTRMPLATTGQQTSSGGGRDGGGNLATIDNPEHYDLATQGESGLAKKSGTAGTAANTESKGDGALATNPDGTLATQSKKIEDTSVRMFESGFKAFWKAVGSWFIKIWTKFIGWISEKRIDSTIKRLNGMSENERAKMQVSININYDKQHQSVEGVPDSYREVFNIGFVLDTGKDFIDILEKINRDIENVSTDEINNLIEMADNFIHNLGSTRKFNNDNPETRNIDGNELRAILNTIKKDVNANKSHVKQLHDAITKNKNIGNELAKKFTTVDDKSGKRIYRAINKAYSAYSTYMAYQMSSFMKLIKESNVKGEIKNPSGPGYSESREISTHVAQ